MAAIGGPLALATIYVPQAADLRSAGILMLLGSLLYALPLAIWVRYSREIVSAGGLAAFVESASGRRLALVQAGIWSVSYFLYLPYTVTDIVYEMLADVFPGIEPWRWVLEIVLPIAIVGLVLLGTRPVLLALTASAAVQLVLVLILGFLILQKVGAPHTTFTRSPGTHDVIRQSASISLLFICGSLPIFLGAEVVGGSRVVRRSLVLAGTLVAAYVLFAVFPLAAVEPALRSSDFPGYDIAHAYSGRTFAVVIGLGTVVSVAGVIVAEYLAFSRLLFSVTGVPVRRLLIWIGIPFVAVDVLSTLSPDEFDKNVLRPSLIALFLSQLIVFAVYPRWRRWRTADVLLALGACALMAWGLYRAIFEGVASS